MRSNTNLLTQSRASAGSVTALAAFARANKIACDGEDDTVAEALYAPLSAALAIATLSTSLLDVPATPSPLRLLVCGCRGLDSPAARWSALEPLLGRTVALTLSGYELDTSSEPPAGLSSSRCVAGSLDDVLGAEQHSTTPPFDAAIVFQPGFQLHRGWAPGMLRLVRGGTAVLCSSLDARECRNDRLVCALYGLNASAPVANPFAPKNASFEAMARDSSRWSGLLWRVTESKAVGTDTNSAHEQMTEAVLADHAKGIWMGYWDNYDLGGNVRVSGTDYVVLGDDHLMTCAQNANKQHPVFFYNRYTPSPVSLCGLCVSAEDAGKLPRSGAASSELCRAFWTSCVRSSYIVPLYDALLGGHVRAFDSPSEAAAFSISQGEEVTEQHLASAVKLDCRVALPKLGKSQVREIRAVNHGTDMRITLANGRKIVAPRAAFHLLAQ